MKRGAVLLAVVGLVGSLALAQVKPGDKAPPPAGGVMMCPMMGMMGATPNAPRAQMMQSMPDRMADMFACSSEDVGKVLAEKKAALALSDAQVKAIADLMASCQRQKVRQAMQGMMTQMQGGMKCPCMQTQPK